MWEWRKMLDGGLLCGVGRWLHNMMVRIDASGGLSCKLVDDDDGVRRWSIVWVKQSVK